uniref:Uncharacterized protein n=1 Tax=Tetraselmis chuii TaxID=63592 RepID=A0A7S1X077_9CHLO
MATLASRMCTLKAELAAKRQPRHNRPGATLPRDRGPPSVSSTPGGISSALLMLSELPRGDELFALSRSSTFRVVTGEVLPSIFVLPSPELHHALPFVSTPTPLPTFCQLLSIADEAQSPTSPPPTIRWILVTASCVTEEAGAMG